MKRFAAKLTLAAVPLLALSLAGPASAQATRTWISGVGDDVNPCSRTAPCKTFPGAISKTATGGEIDTLDPGGFGGVTVTKSISLVNDGIGEAGILVAGTNGVTINAPADAIVRIRGLIIDGGPIGSNSLSGVSILSAGEVQIENTVIKNFTNATVGLGNGVNVVPGTNSVKVTLNNVTIQNNGTATSGGGVMIKPTGSAKANVTVNNSMLTGNTVGLKADGGGGTGAITVQVTNSTANNSLSQGFNATSNPGATTSLFIDNSTASNNGSPGLRVQGANASATINRSNFINNGGPGLQSQNGGVLNSYRNNTSVGNVGADSTTVQLTPQ